MQYSNILHFFTSLLRPAHYCKRNSKSFTTMLAVCVGMILCILLAAQPLSANEDSSTPVTNYNIKQNTPILSLHNSQSGQSLVPYMDYMVDVSGMATLLELFSPSYENAFTPLDNGIPLTDTGSTWLRLSIVPDSETTHVIALGTELATDVKIYIPEFSQYIENKEHFSKSLDAPNGGVGKANVATPWHEVSIPHGEAITLPALNNPEILQQIQTIGIPIYIHMAGTPEPWFTPQLRTITDIAHDYNRLIHFGITMMLAAVLALCLLRAFTEKGQWRLWTTFFTASLLLQSLIGLPITPHGSIGLSGLPHVLAPAIALMLLPHIARHMLQRTSFSPKYVPALGSHLDGDLDRQYRFLSIPCILIAILPLLPSMGWLGKLLPLWPLAIILFIPTTLIAVFRGIAGAKLFLLGCLIAILGGLCASIAMLMDIPAILINAMPLCCTALCALIIAGASSVRGASHGNNTQQGEYGGIKSGIAVGENYSDPLQGEGLRLLSAEEGLATGIVVHDESNDMDSQILSVRVISPERARSLEARGADCSPETELHEANEAPSPTAILASAESTSKNPEKIELANTNITVHEAAPSGSLASSLRGPLTQDDLHTLMRAEEAMRYPLETLRKNMEALQKCSLHPDTQKLCDEASTASKQLDLVGEEFRRATYSLPAEQNSTIFHLQRCLREAHDNVCAQSDAKNIALSWFMAPHLVPTYEGDAGRLRTTLRVLMESAVDATESGSVYLSARRVPESTNPGHLLFTITDTGVGGPPDKRKASALMQAWELATSTGGSLSIDSGLHGTTISFSTRFLAIHSDNAPASRDDISRVKRDVHSSVNSSAPHKHKRIIIGAPATSNRQLLAFYLEDTAYYADEALSSLDVMGKYTSDGADLIILDSDMMEGEIAKIIETIRKYEAEHDVAAVPFLALVRDEAQADALLHMGCTQTLLKPVTRSGLCAQAALLAPIVVMPLNAEAQPAAEQAEVAQVVENTLEADTMEESQALTPDMISSTLAEAMELLTAPAMPQEAKETVDNADSAVAEVTEITEVTETAVVTELATDTADAGETTTVDEVRHTQKTSAPVTPVESVEPVEPVTPTEPVDPVEKVTPTPAAEAEIEDPERASCPDVPTSKAEDLTLRIYDDYLKNCTSSVSSSMQDLDPVLFTNIFGSPAKDKAQATPAITKSTSHTQIRNADEPCKHDDNPLPSSSMDAPSTYDDVDFEPQVSTPRPCTKPAELAPSHQVVQPSQGTEDIDNKAQEIQAASTNEQSQGFVYNDVESEVSAPRAVNSDATASVSVSDKTPKAKHVEAKQAQHTTQAAAPLERGNEVYVEEITVGTEVLRLYKVPTKPLDPDAEYEAMLQREAELEREQGDMPAITDFQEEPSAPVHEELETVQENLATVELHSMMAPPSLQEPAQSDTATYTPEAPVAEAPVAEVPVHNEYTALEPTAPVIELSHAISIQHEYTEQPSPITIAKEVDHGNAVADAPNAYTPDTYIPDDYVPDAYIPDDYSSDEYADADQGADQGADQEIQKPSAVARATAALLAVCNNLREPAPLRLKGKTLPSLRKLRDTFETSFGSDTQTAHNAGTTDHKQHTDTAHVSADSMVTANPYDDTSSDISTAGSPAGPTAIPQAIPDGAESATPSTPNSEQGPRFVSIVQSVNEIAATIKPAASILRHSSQKDFVPKLITELEHALAEANTAYEQDDVLALRASSGRIADNAEVLGLRALERHARCVERAAQANDLGAARELYADMENVVHRTISALRTSGLSGAHRM